MAAQFRGEKIPVLLDMTGNTLDLEETLIIPNFKKKTVSLSKLLAYLQGGWGVDQISFKDIKKQAITIKRKFNKHIFCLIGIYVNSEVYVFNKVTYINEARNKS